MPEGGLERFRLAVLQVDGPFEADRAAWVLAETPNGIGEVGGRVSTHCRRPDGTRREQRKLVSGFVNDTSALPEVLAGDLTGDVQHWRTGSQRLDERTGGIGRAGARRGHRTAGGAADPGVAVGGVDRCGFAACRHPAQPVRERIHQRQVVDADHAEGSVDPQGRQYLDQQVAAVALPAGSHGITKPPSTTMVCPVM